MAAADRFAQLLGKVADVQQRCVSEGTQKAYNSCMRVYDKTIRAMGVDPYPVTLEKIKVFLVDKQEEGRTFGTLSNYVHAPSYILRRS